MSKVLQRATAMLSVIASLVIATAALAADADIPLEEGRAIPGA